MNVLIVIVLSAIVYFLMTSITSVGSLVVSLIFGIVVPIILVKLFKTNRVTGWLSIAVTILLALYISYCAGNSFYNAWLYSSKATAVGSKLAVYLKLDSFNHTSGFLNVLAPTLAILSIPFTYYFVSIFTSRVPITKKSVLMILGLFALTTTDAIFIVYFILCFIGIWCEQTVYSCQIRIPVELCAVCISLCVLFANYKIWVINNQWFLSTIILLTILTGSFFVARSILYYCNNLITQNPPKKHPLNYNSRQYSFITFAAIIVLCGIYLFLSNYPGNLSADSINQMNQIVADSYSNHHPFWHTQLIRICYSLGTLLFHDINAAVSVYSFFQILLMAFSFSYAVMTLADIGIPQVFLFGCMIFYIFMPYHLNYSITMWKNIPFSLSVLNFINAYFRYTRNLGNYTQNGILIVLSGLGICLFQSNGIIAFIIMMAVFFLLFHKENWKVTVLYGITLVIAGVLLYPVMDYFHVEKGDFIESLSIPAQQIARVIVDEGNITEEQMSELEKIVDTVSVKCLYQNYISDPVKDLVREKGNQNYLVQNKLSYLKLWVQIGLKNPWSYLKAWIDQTKGYWNGGYRHWLLCTWVGENTLGIKRTVLVPLCNSVFNSYLHQTTSDFFGIFRSIGVFTWLSLASLVLNLINHRKTVAFLAIPSLSIILTLLISVPVYCEFRYAYSLFTTMPFIFAITFCYNPKSE